MNQKTPRALVEFAAILVVVGLIVMDPLAGFSLLVLAGVFTAIALAFGSRRLRLVAVILLAIICLLAVGKYPDARLHLQRYREQAHKQSIMLPDQKDQNEAGRDGLNNLCLLCHNTMSSENGIC